MFVKERNDGLDRTAAYQFSVETKDDPSIDVIKLAASRLNAVQRENEELGYQSTTNTFNGRKLRKRYFVRVRARGFRNRNALDTPHNDPRVTHYDCYLSERTLIEGFDF